MTLVRFEVDISVLAPKWLPTDGLGLDSQMKVLWPTNCGWVFRTTFKGYEIGHI